MIQSPNRQALCVKCFEIRPITKHHVCPRIFFGRRNCTEINLCIDCHKEIHEIIPNNYKLSRGEYLDVTKQWLRGVNVMVKYGEKKEKKGDALCLAGNAVI